MIGPYKFYKSANLYLCYLNNKFKDRKKSNVHLCGFLKVTVSSAVRLYQVEMLTFYETKGRQTLWKKCILTKFKSRLKFGGRL